MKRMKKLILFASLTMFVSSCSVFENENDEPPVSAIIEGDELVIKNNLSIDVYYFAVSQASLPYIFWAPLVTEENEVEPGNYITLDTSQVYRDGTPEPVVVYYWDEDVTEIFSILIE